MSRRSWRVSLQKTATNLNARVKSPRIAVLGVGNELNGDDAAGVIALRILNQKELAAGQFLWIETGPSPENFTAPVIRFAPDWVIIIDAARLGYQPGQIAYFGMDEIVGASAFTHGLPLSMIGEYLVRQTNCQIGLLGIQVAQTGFGVPPTLAVTRAAERVGTFLSEVLISIS